MGMLEGKTVIVTGGGQGIGRAIAMRMAREGASVVVNSVREESCGGVAGEIQKEGGKAIAVAGDVGNHEAVDKVVSAAAEEFGGVSILINNAGITRDNLIMRMKEEDWDDVHRVNLKSAFLMSKAVVRPMMKERWGRIINITSIVGLVGNPGQANYCAAKAGMVGLTKSLAKELASRNILVNAVAPGFIETRMTDDLGEEMKGKLLSEIPLGRIGVAEDVAGPVLFLCSEDSSYLTGTVLEATGGLGM